MKYASDPEGPRPRRLRTVGSAAGGAGHGRSPAETMTAAARPVATWPGDLMVKGGAGEITAIQKQYEDRLNQLPKPGGGGRHRLTTHCTGTLSAPLLSMFVIPAGFLLLRSRRLEAAEEGADEGRGLRP